MRLFIALQPSPAFRSALSELSENLRAAGVTGRYRDPAGMHLTLAFIGEWPEDLTGLLPPVPRPFSLTLSHPGIFPGANVLWAGVEPSGELDALAANIRQSLAAAGVPFDRKDFRPHITLARKPCVPDGLLLPAFPVPAASMVVEDLCLYRSDRAAGGMEYTVIGRSARAKGAGSLWA